MEPSAPRDDELSVAHAAHTEDFVRMVRVLLAPGPVATVLERIVRLAVLAIDGCAEAGLCGVEPAVTVGGGSPTALDLLQAATGQGPCEDVLTGTDMVHSADLCADSRWPDLATRAAEHGVRSALAVRLAAGHETLGALHLAGREPDAFGQVARVQALLFAAHAGLALSAARIHAADELRADQLRSAMLTRQVIGQAQGILMERERVTAERAFALIREASQRLNVKLRDVAQELVDTGLLPGDALLPTPR